MFLDTEPPPRGQEWAPPVLVLCEGGAWAARAATRRHSRFTQPGGGKALCQCVGAWFTPLLLLVVNLFVACDML
jgi:hypothetical protein